MTSRLSAAPAEPTVDTAKPTEEELKQDQEVVQKAISDAVTAALNNDDFTKAVAVHLATQLQPTLKSALDISTVEENLSRRLDEIQTATTARLSDLSNDLNTLKSADKTAGLEEAVTQINVLLAALGKDVKAVQEQISQPDTTILSAHSTKLDGIATDLKTLQEQGPAPVGAALSSHTAKLDALATELKAVQEQIASPDTSLLSSHSTKLDAITAELAAAKENSETTTALKTITSDLAALKTDIEAGATSSSTGISGLSSQITSVQSEIEAQTTTLSEIKAADASSDILAGIKISNDSHASHTAALSTLAPKDNSADLADLKSQVATLSTTVSELKSSDISPEILSAVKSSNESHAAHATTLAEIKTATSTPAATAEKVDLTTIETDVKTILTTLESQSSTLSEIKTVADTPAPAAEKTDISALEADVKTLITNLESHSGSVADLKTSSGATGAEILAAISAQDTILSQLKDGKPSPEVLAAIEALKTDITGSNARVTETHDSVNVLVHALPKVDNDEILTEVKGVKAAIGSIEIPKFDNTEVISEIKAVKTLVSETKDTEILAEVKEIKVLVEKNAVTAKVQEVGENDKGVEVKKETGSNGVEVAEKEIEA
jgi:hypothetical protein